MKLRLREIRINRHEVCWDIVLYTDRGMIPAGNVIHAHARDFVVYDELLLPILSAFAQNTRSQHAPRNPRCFQSPCSNRRVCRSYQ
jgi:hypothetical protein